MNMVEKLARAYCVTGDPVFQYDMEGQVGAELRALYIEKARAGLVALLEPDDTMIAAGEAKGGRAWDYTGDTKVVNPELGFRAMIQAALDEATP